MTAMDCKWREGLIMLYTYTVKQVSITQNRNLFIHTVRTSICSPCEATQLCLHKFPLTLRCSVCTCHWAVDLLLCQSVCGFHYNVVQSIWLQCWDVVRQLWCAGHNDLIVWCTTLSVQNPERCWLGIPLHIQPAWTRQNVHCRRFKY